MIVQVGLKEGTIKELQKIANTLGVENKANMLSYCITLTGLVIKSIKSGKKVYIEDENGKREVIRIKDGAY